MSDGSKPNGLRSSWVSRVRIKTLYSFCVDFDLFLLRQVVQDI